jgi:hypothetical protein
MPPAGMHASCQGSLSSPACPVALHCGTGAIQCPKQPGTKSDTGALMVPVAAPPQAWHHTAGAALHITIYHTLLAGAVPHKDPGKPSPPTDTHKLLVAAAPLPLHTRSQLQLAPALCVDLRSQLQQVSTMITGEAGCTNCQSTVEARQVDQLLSWSHATSNVHHLHQHRQYSN